MKEVQEVTACVVDAGTFVPLAESLAETFHKVFYHSPWECEYLDLTDCVIGDGLPKVERLDEFMDPDVFGEIDLFIFPDIGYGGLQRYLRSVGKAVWGSMGASDLELFRTRFIKTLDQLGLDHVPSLTVRGLTNLENHLKKVDRKWIKINRYRGNMETRFHIDWDHSRRWLESLRVTFGGMSEYVVFVVQDPIEGEDGNPVLEVGYDGWCIDGKNPPSSFQGYEKKNQLYLGSLRTYEQLPEQVRAVNEAMAPILEQYGYRNFWATEIRILGDKFYFIDPTARMPGQTGEQILETCTNLPEVIWKGSHGEVVTPEFAYKFAAEGTLHYENSSPDEWKVLRVPDEVKQWFKLYQFCKADGLYHFPPSPIDEVGVVLGLGDTAEEAIDALKENFENLGEEPVSVELSGFVDLLKQIEEAESCGVVFTEKPMPKPESVLL